MRDNNMFQEDQGNFYRSIKAKQERKGNVRKMEKFVSSWAGIWEDESITQRMDGESSANESGTLSDIVKREITEERLKEVVRKRKNSSAPGINGIQNYRWKKFTGVRK